MSERFGQLLELPITEFILHSGPMLLPDRLVSLNIDSAVCEWCVRENNVFMVAGSGVPAYIGIEYMAQCVAVHGGACERSLGFAPPQGLLLGTRRYHCEVPYFVPGVTYQVKCNKLISNPDGMSSFDCSILLDHRVIAQGRISVLQKARGESFNE